MRKKKSILTILLILFFIGIALLLWHFMRPKIQFKQASFAQLPNWHATEMNTSFKAFQISCGAFIKQDPDKQVGTEVIPLRIKDWLPACNEALKINSVNEAQAKSFFEKWFVPVEFYDKGQVEGLFTGYYMPLLKGSLTPTPEFNVPIYETPRDMIHVDVNLFLPHLKMKPLIGRIHNAKLIPYYTREDINKGAIKDTAKVLVWIHSPVDRIFLEIEGSGIIELQDKTKIYIGYSSQNGLPYRSIVGVLIKEGIMSKENASMQGIKNYLESHPKEMDNILNQNKSFVFFQKLNTKAAYGTQGVPLTPEYSLAVDLKWIPLGMPLWLNTSNPTMEDQDKNEPLNRLMIAQDSGGAIKGKVRADVYWGSSEKATIMGGHMKNKGYYWLLIPRQFLPTLGKYLKN
ncbi:MAG: murein transglycosylase A [Legionella sp.]|nr:murein transglycosylase A [Legionella sp.]